MDFIKKIAFRILLLAVILLLLNLLYKFLFFKGDIHLYSPLYEKFINATKDSDILYFGESSNASYGPTDTCTKSICQLTADHFKGLKFASVDTGAIHAGIYYELIKKIPANSKVKAIIVTMNLRSFNADWRYSKLESAIQQSMLLTHNSPVILNRFLLALNAWDKITEKESWHSVTKEWETFPLTFPFSTKYKTTQEWVWALDEQLKQNNNQNKKKRDLILQYVKTYAFKIDTTTNIRIKDFDNIVAYCKSRKLKLYFNLLAENTEKATELVGKELADIIRFNRDLLANRYSKDAVVIDNLEKVISSEYIDQTWTTEHYYQAGRMIISRNIAKVLSNNFKNEFNDIYANTQMPFHKEGNLADFLWKLKIYTKQIKDSKEWVDRLRLKAVEQKLTLDTMIYLDAKWMIERTDKIVVENIDEKIAAIEKCKKKMLSDTAWVSNLKQKSLRDKISLDSMILKDAIWLVGSSNF